ncbi:tryptophan synthase subunit alpha [Peribacillus sp. SCS-26]|uniref:tryptophan synthase subunit alpha n=1 Tax=Paraperibacillus marinus TaxID=3115295 RepID=UPI0039067840
MSKGRLRETFQDLKKKDQKAFVAYIMGGDGGIGRLISDILYLQESGADVIEVGVPFSDPVADGPVIQDAGLRALKEGTTLKSILKEIQEGKDKIKVPIVLMTYINPVLQYGIREFSRDSAAAGIAGCIFPDLPLEEEGLISSVLTEANIAIIRLASLTSTEDRLEKLAGSSEGFLYAVTVKGVTGQRARLETEELAARVRTIKQFTDTPVLAGFGISSADTAGGVLPFCDGVIVGSKIVAALHEGERETIRELIGEIKGLHAVSAR